MGCVFYPDCSPLCGYGVAWQKQMALETSFPQVETEEHKDCQEKEKRKELVWKYRRGKCFWNSSGPFDCSCFSYWHQSIFVVLFSYVKKVILGGIQRKEKVEEYETECGW